MGWRHQPRDLPTAILLCVIGAILLTACWPHMDGGDSYSNPDWQAINANESVNVTISADTFDHGDATCNGPIWISVSVYGNASGGLNPYNWTWTFGDGSALAFTQNASHTYDSIGPYNITLWVRSSTGGNGSANIVAQAALSAGAPCGTPLLIILAPFLVGGSIALVIASAIVILRNSR